MRAMVLHSFAPAGGGLRLEEVPMPAIGPQQVLVRMRATSLNPIDVRRGGGYGRNIFAALANVRLPLILGRDISGVVEAVGEQVAGLKPGDAVWGASNNLVSGAFSEFVVADEKTVSLKPPGLSFLEAASIPYVALTSWVAMVDNAGLSATGARGKRILVHGGAGGIGSYSIQWLKAWGAEVATTCSTGNRDFVAGLGADVVIDYTSEDFAARLRDYDVVYNAVDFGLESRSLRILKRFGGAQYATIVHPMMPWTDRFGYALGHRLAVARRQARAMEQRRLHGRAYHWTLFHPNIAAMATVAELVAAGRIKPVIGRVFPFAEMPAAFALSATGHARGKIVVTFGGAD